MEAQWLMGRGQILEAGWSSFSRAREGGGGGEGAKAPVSPGSPLCFCQLL